MCNRYTSPRTRVTVAALINRRTIPGLYGDPAGFFGIAPASSWPVSLFTVGAPSTQWRELNPLWLPDSLPWREATIAPVIAACKSRSSRHVPTLSRFTTYPRCSRGPDKPAEVSIVERPCRDVSGGTDFPGRVPVGFIRITSGRAGNRTLIRHGPL